MPDHVVIGTRTRGMLLAEPVTLSRDDRRRHLHVLGATGTGKTNTLQVLAFADAAAGRGFAIVDPLGGLAEAVVDAIPVARTDETIYWAPGADLEHVVGFNPLDRVPPDQRHLVADHLVSVFGHIWGASLAETPRLVYLIYNGARLLLDIPDGDATLLGLPRLLVDDGFRRRLLRSCRDDMVRGFWEDEFGRFDERFREQVVAPLQNKIGMLLAPPVLRRILGQPRSTIDLRRLMNGGGILIANLAKGRLGGTGARLLGALLATSIMQVAEERVAVAPEARRDFTLITDELHNVVTEAFADGLAEARQMRLAIVASHQVMGRLPPSVRDGLLGNCGTSIFFRAGSQDAPALAAHIGMGNERELASTENFKAWCRLLQDGVPSEPFLLETSKATPPVVGRAAAVIAHTRARHCRPRAMVDGMVAAQLDRR